MTDFLDTSALSTPIDDLVDQVRTAVIRALDERDTSADGRMDPDLEQAYARELIARELERLARDQLASGDRPIDADAEEAIGREVLAGIYGLGPLERYLRDDRVENVVVNGYDEVLVYLCDGTATTVPPLWHSNQELVDWVQQAASRMGRTERRFDRSEPFVDLRLHDGSRLHAVRELCDPPVSITVRKHRFLKVTLGDLVGMGTLSDDLCQVLTAAVRARLNILVCGGTDSGKTTFLRALLAAADPQERLVVVEDDAELDLRASGRTNVVNLEGRRANTEAAGSVDLRQLVRQARRMRPDRVVVGEVRGGEAFEMLDAMSLGNDGSMCTLHANSTAAAFSKTIEFVQRASQNTSDTTAARMIANALDLVVHLHKPDRLGSTRVVSSVREVAGAEGATMLSNEVYAPGSDGRAVATYPFTTGVVDRLLDAGLDPGILGTVTGSWR